MTIIATHSSVVTSSSADAEIVHMRAMLNATGSEHDFGHF